MILNSNKARIWIIHTWNLVNSGNNEDQSDSVVENSGVCLPNPEHINAEVGDEKNDKNEDEK